MVLVQLEDYGFCAKGEGGASCSPPHFASAEPSHQHIGRSASEAHVEGMLQIVEACASCGAIYPATRNVKDAEIALISVTAAIRSATPR